MARQFEEETRHQPGAEIEVPRLTRPDPDDRHLPVEGPDAALELRELISIQRLLDASRYSSATPSTMSTVATARIKSCFASVGVSPTSIVSATTFRDDNAATLGAVAAVQMTI